MYLMCYNKILFFLNKCQSNVIFSKKKYYSLLHQFIVYLYVKMFSFSKKYFCNERAIDISPVIKKNQYNKFDVRKSVQYRSIQIIQPTRCNSFTSLLLHIYEWLNMFRVSPRPSSGAYNCIRSLWFYRWEHGG
jgi:hypothetical protein